MFSPRGCCSPQALAQPAGVLRGAALLAAATVVVCAALLSLAAAPPTAPGAGGGASGPLRVHPTNPRYFADASGNPVYLTGSHTWSNLQDEWTDNYGGPFDYAAYLDMLESHHHNFIRLWRVEMPMYRYESFNGQFAYSWPHPWMRTGPGLAGDGLPRFDLNQFDPVYFQRLRERCVLAGQRGMYVCIMLFDGHSIANTIDGWFSHPFNIANNVNGVDGDADGDQRGLEINTLQIPAVLSRQHAYVRRVIDTVNDLDNVMYEIANEAHGGSVPWQYHLIHFIHEYERSMPRQHPVLFSTPLADINQELWDSPAEAISPGFMIDDNAYAFDPPAADGRKVIINDSDHVFGCGQDAQWVFRSFARGLNPIYMDSYYDDSPFCSPPSHVVRRYMGYARGYAQRMNLVNALPRNELSSTGYCLADTGATYFVYAPDGGAMWVNLSAVSGRLRVEWFNPATGVATGAAAVQGGGVRQFTPPFAGEAVLFLFGGTSSVQVVPVPPSGKGQPPSSGVGTGAPPPGEGGIGTIGGGG